MSLERLTFDFAARPAALGGEFLRVGFYCFVRLLPLEPQLRLRVLLLLLLL